MSSNALNRWERLPEYLASRTYVRCLDRLFQSLPPETQWRMFQPMLSAAVSIGTGIACFHGDFLLPELGTAAEREGHRQRALEGIRASRDGLEEIAAVPGASRADLMVARELLERIEGSVRRARLP